MGSSPRSYGYRFNWRGLLTPAIKTLLIANTGVFMVQTLVALLVGPAGNEKAKKGGKGAEPKPEEAEGDE